MPIPALLLIVGLPLVAYLTKVVGISKAVEIKRRGNNIINLLNAKLSASGVWQLVVIPIL